MIGLSLGLILFFAGCGSTTVSRGLDTSSKIEIDANVASIQPSSSPTVPVKVTDVRVAEIDQYCDSLHAESSKNAAPDRIFADTADVYERRPKWKEFKSIEELDAFREESETYFIAYNWFSKSRLTSTSFTIFSGSGDWAKYVRSCYRENGTLARVWIDYRTFYGHFRMERNLYFAPNGEEIHGTQEFRRMDSDELFQPDQESLNANSSLKAEDFFMTASEIPYSKLLKKK